MEKIFSVLIIIILIFSVSSCTNNSPQPQFSKNDLIFDQLATRWDEAIPLGNGMLGALIWQNGKRLRFSLDRADLWDLRPMENLDKPEWKFKWVHHGKATKLKQILRGTPWRKSAKINDF